MALSTPLRLLWLKNIHLAKGPRSITTEKFLTSKNTTINRPLINGKFTTYINNPSKTVEFYSHEADRFAAAAFESIEVSRSDPTHHPRSIGWRLIKAYYAAFFALHALIRIHGWACTRLTADTINLINKQIAALYPNSDKVSGGLYFIRADQSGSELSFEKINTGATGGSHECLWGFLQIYIDEIINTTLSFRLDHEETQVVVSTLESFKTFVQKKGGAVWFTQVRNRINYSHGYGAWFPYTGSTCDLTRIDRAIEKWKEAPDLNIPNTSDDEPLQFAAACSFIVSICRISVTDLKYRAVAQSPFKRSSGALLQEL